MGDQEFWKLKMETYFDRIDFDRDGAITKKDFDDMADRFLKTGKFDDSKDDLRATLTAVWDKHLSKVAAGQTIDQKTFVAGMKTLRGDKEHQKDLLGPLPLFFHAVDSNNDKMIDAAEYGDFFEILGLDRNMAGDTFKAIDTNNDGLLSLAEFKDAGLKFFTSDDKECPSKWFWGPLVGDKK